MKDIQDLLIAIEHTAHMVAAIHTLGASLAAGLHAGVVEPDHLPLLLDTHVKAISAGLDQLASDVARRKR